MATPKVSLEFRLRDLVSAPARRVASSVSDIGKSARQAFASLGEIGAQFDAAIAGIEATIGKLDTARSLKERLVDPLADAAAEVEQASKVLAANLPQGPQLSMQIEAAKRDAATVSGPTNMSDAEVLKLRTQFITAGLSFDDAGSAAAAGAQLATAENLDAGQSFEAINGLKIAFGLAGDKLMDGADLLVRGAAAGQAGPAEMAATLANFSMGQIANVDMRDSMVAFAAISGKMRGGEAGTAADAFLQRIATVDKKAKLGMYDESGRFKGFEAAGARLAEVTKTMNDQQKLQFMTKTFGEGPAAAFAATLSQADFAGTVSQMDAALPLADKTKMMLDSLNGQVGALGGSVESLKAVLGEPLLAPFKGIAEGANELAGRLAIAAREDPRIAQGVAGGAAGVVGLAGVAAMAQMPGGLAGALKGAVGRTGGLATGLATGKAMEAAGAQPVYVVNYAEFGMGGVGALGAGGAAVAGGSSGVLGKIGKAGGIAALAATLAEANQWIGTSVRDWGQKQGGVMGDYLALSGSTSMRVTPLSTMSDEESAKNAAIQQQSYNSLMSRLGLDVKVSVDGEGVASAEANWRQNRAAERTAMRMAM